MIPRRHLGDLDLELVLAPFRAAADRVVVRIEDDRGVALATSGSDEAPAGEARHRAIASVTVHDEAAGRVPMVDRGGA